MSRCFTHVSRPTPVRGGWPCRPRRGLGPEATPSFSACTQIARRLPADCPCPVLCVAKGVGDIAGALLFQCRSLGNELKHYCLLLPLSICPIHSSVLCNEDCFVVSRAGRSPPAVRHVCRELRPCGHSTSSLLRSWCRMLLRQCSLDGRTERERERERERGPPKAWGVQGWGALGSQGAGLVRARRTLRTPTKAPKGAPRGCQQGGQGHHKSLT